MVSSVLGMVKKGKSAEKKNYVVVKTSHGGLEGGPYTSGQGPASAARKAARQRFTKANSKIRITVRATHGTREFTYNVTRVKLAKPVVRMIKGKEIVNNYEIKCVKAKP
jgi:hypothetical protein